MISGTFQFGGDDIEIWEEDNNVNLSQGNAKIIIPKDAFDTFTEWIAQKTASASEFPYQDWIEAISSDGVGLTTWEKDFMTSIATRVSAHGIKGLSEKQLGIIKRIYEEKVQ
jgi:hypothetical protein